MLEQLGITIHRKGQAVESVQMKGLRVSLLASSGGTEVIYHSLTAGSRWSMVPDVGWHALECITILSGELILKSPEEDFTLHPGDSISSNPIQQHAIFVAAVDTDFLYVSSQPVFHHYSMITREMMELAVSIEEKDGYTADHCHRIMKMSMRVGEEMNFSSDKMHVLNFGAFFHDIGKIEVPEEVLNKPGKLTPEEWKIMKLHTVHGREILERTDLPHLIAAGRIVEQHHERYDGAGYPHGLKGDEIDIAAAIISVVDSFDAMTTDRVYQKGRSKAEALAEILRCRGTMYHPDVVDVFISILQESEKEQ
jgi:putative nucleotidyltransferase with HDIG domain